MPVETYDTFDYDVLIVGATASNVKVYVEEARFYSWTRSQFASSGASAEMTSAV